MTFHTDDTLIAGEPHDPRAQEPLTDGYSPAAHPAGPAAAELPSAGAPSTLVAA